MKHRHKFVYMKTARNFAELSYAKRLQVGCILVKNDTIIAHGWNGQPCNWHTNNCEDENNNTLLTVKHAEANTLAKLFNSTNTSNGSSVFVTHSPCISCSIDLKIANIKEVYFEELYRSEEGIKYLYNNSIDVYQIKNNKIYAMFFDYIKNEIIWSEVN